MKSVSKLSLSKIAGVTPGAISKAIQRGKLDVLPGGSIDAESEKSVAFIQSAKARKKPKKKPAPQKKAKPTSDSRVAPPHLDDPDEAEISAAMGELELKRRKLAAQAQQLELKNAQIEGRLVAREVMVRGVWNPLETFLVRLLTDGAKTITSTAFSLVRSGLEAEARGEKGVTREAVEVAIREEISSLVKPLKRDIKKALLDDV